MQAVRSQTASHANTAVCEHRHVFFDSARQARFLVFWNHCYTFSIEKSTGSMVEQNVSKLDPAAPTAEGHRGRR